MTLMLKRDVLLKRRAMNQLASILQGSPGFSPSANHAACAPRASVIAATTRAIRSRSARIPRSPADRSNATFAAYASRGRATSAGFLVEPAVTQAIESQRAAFADIGVTIEDAEPDLDGADDVQTQRGVGFLRFGDLLYMHPTAFKDTIVWNIGVGRKSTGTQVGEAAKLRSDILRPHARFHGALRVPHRAGQPVVPFSIDQQYVTQINGVRMQNYLEWMRSCYFIAIDDE